MEKFNIWRSVTAARRADKERCYEMSKLLCLALGDSIEEHVTEHGKYFIARKARAEEGTT